MKPAIDHPRLDPSANPDLQELADLVGVFIEYWGFKAVQGRMWCYLYVSKKPLSSIELSQLLEISPSLVTQSIKVLLSFNLVKEAEKGPNGVLRFHANEDVSGAISGVLKKRELEMLKQVKISSLVLSKNASGSKPIEVNKVRVQLVKQWVDLAEIFLRMAIGALDSHDSPFRKPNSYLKKSFLRRTLEHLVPFK
jgi:DNA-binding transcriptional regulator GbsR (MarR family)